MSGLVGAITSGKGGATASGAMTGGRPLPSSFQVISRSGKDMRSVRLGMAGGNVVAVDITPPSSRARTGFRWPTPTRRVSSTP
jgi:hypothetical protein